MNTGKSTTRDEVAGVLKPSVLRLKGDVKSKSATTMLRMSLEQWLVVAEIGRMQIRPLKTFLSVLGRLTMKGIVDEG